jgi:hypothetical protein
MAATVATAKIVLRIMSVSLVSYWMCSHILPVCRVNDLSVQQRAEFVSLNRPFGDGHHEMSVWGQECVRIHSGADNCMSAFGHHSASEWSI